MLGAAPHDARAAAPALVPEGTVIYAIGDIHGRLDLLQRLEATIQQDAASGSAERRLIVYLGDYVDRGDESRGVIEHLCEAPPRGFERVCLMGNHEDYMLRFLDDESLLAPWISNGGGETLASYGIVPAAGRAGDGSAAALRAQFRACLPDTHKAFLSALASSHREGDYLFVHAGVRPGVPLDRQDPYDLMWIRGEFLSDGRDFGAVVVHGHSISQAPENLRNRIGIDTGAYATGHLTCAVLWRDERRFLST